MSIEVPPGPDGRPRAAIPRAATVNVEVFDQRVDVQLLTRADLLTAECPCKLPECLGDRLIVLGCECPAEEPRLMRLMYHKAENVVSMHCGSCGQITAVRVAADA